MTDEERYPPPYEAGGAGRVPADPAAGARAPAGRGLELHRHYAGSTACLPSRATLFTGQYPSLHGVHEHRRHGQGGIRPGDDAGSIPTRCPTMGDWFRAARLPDPLPGQVARLPCRPPRSPATHEGLGANDATALVDDAVDGVPTGRPPRSVRVLGLDRAGAARRRPGRQRHRPRPRSSPSRWPSSSASWPSDRDEGPWLTVASFVNPHDIAFAGFGWEAARIRADADERCPTSPRRPARRDSLDERPTAQGQFRGAGPDALRPAGRPRLPPALLLAPQAGRPGDRPDPRRARGVGHGRGHDRGVHLRPRRPARARTAASSRSGTTATTRRIRVPLVVRGPGVDAGPAGSTCPPATST